MNPMTDSEVLDAIAQILRAVNEKNDILSPLGIDLLSCIIENTGRNAR